MSTILIYTMDAVLKQVLTVNKLYVGTTIAFREKVMHMLDFASNSETKVIFMINIFAL